MGKYICKDCGSMNVENKCWVDMNTDEVMDSAGVDDIEDNWCRECGEHTEIKYVGDE